MPLCLSIPLLSHVRVFLPAVAPPALPAVDPCVGSACGDNAECSVIGNYADCKCKPDYYGNPYVACKPECVVDSDCPRYLDCVRNKCIDPCPGACGINAICDVLNHQAMCNCPTGYTGSPLARCHPAQEVISKCSEGISVGDLEVLP